MKRNYVVTPNMLRKQKLSEEIQANILRKAKEREMQAAANPPIVEKEEVVRKEALEKIKRETRPDSPMDFEYTTMPQGQTSLTVIDIEYARILNMSMLKLEDKDRMETEFTDLGEQALSSNRIKAAECNVPEFEHQDVFKEKAMEYCLSVLPENSSLQNHGACENDEKNSEFCKKPHHVTNRPIAIPVKSRRNRKAPHGVQHNKNNRYE